MKIESKVDVVQMNVILEALKKAQITQNLSGSLDLLKAVDYLQKAVAEFLNPTPQNPVISGQDELNKRVVQFKPTGGKKK